MEEESSEWAKELRECDFEMAKAEITQMLHTWVEDAKSKGGQYYIPQEYKRLLDSFLLNPCLETAVSLLEYSPNLLPYFQECSPGGFTYLCNQILKNDNSQ